MNVLSLFAGIGGFDLAFSRLGVGLVAAVEVDAAARQVLARHFPETVLFDDVREVSGDQLRTAGFVPERGILAAGWPCQGNSVAGRRGGMADPRSGLWRHVVRLLDETRPAWFVGENVPGLLSINQGRDFGAVIGDLDELGYGLAWRVLDAQWFGVPQRRRRVFIVGRAGDPVGPTHVLLESDCGGRDSASRRTAGQAVAALTADGVGTCGVDDNQAQAGHLIASAVTARESKGPDFDVTTTLVFDAAQITHPENRANPHPGDPAAPLAATGQPMVAHALTSEGADASEDGTGRGTPLVPVSLAVGQDYSTGEDIAQPVTGSNGQPGVIATTAVRRLTPVECERLQGFPDGWTDGQSDSARYRQLGNAVAVPVAEWIARRLLELEEVTT